jgi:hypothetical protein
VLWYDSSRAALALQDHFLTNRPAILKLHELLNRKDAHRFAVKHGKEFYEKLIADKDWGHLFKPIPRSTLCGWFTFSGTAAPAVPKPKDVFLNGHTKGYNDQLRKSTGRPKLLVGCEGTLDKFNTDVREFREAGEHPVRCTAYAHATGSALVLISGALHH